ncbi:hypothetical protein KVR01_012739 [Diaporthe batatas]|uniref:uncharacterized protein n=1 Tax=Diaporthe batatas TaxID=748121 RepID=UPI001D03F6EF|nr:uncharacterized protein KVR01_012739 [Diaporthe batatas]KAG8157355.1 hypothetical protein KVR01_012739 [Diaporthe batatas]
MSSQGGQEGDGANNQDSQQQLVKIDPDGDLTLVVGSKKTHFLVCSKALSRSAPFWKRCLYGQFKEAKPEGEQKWIVEFPEDNPSAMNYILLLTHALGHKLPEVDLKLAFEITVLTNKYDMTQLLWPVARSWLDDLEPPAPDESDDDTVIPQLQWLWVAKELGGIEEYIKTSVDLSHIVSTAAEGDDANLVLRPYQPGDGSVLSKEDLEGYEAEKDVILHLANEVKRARKVAIYKIQTVLKADIKMLRDTIREFDSSEGCRGAIICTGQKAKGLVSFNKQRLCEYAMQAIVTKISAGKDSAVKPIAKICISVEDYLASAVCFTSRIEREIHIVCGDDHKTCTPFQSKLPSQKDLRALTSVIWRYKNTNAFERQARISGLEKAGMNDEDEDQGNTGRKRSRDEFEAAASG